jgi:hypothetical protein
MPALNGDDYHVACNDLEIIKSPVRPDPTPEQLQAMREFIGQWQKTHRAVVFLGTIARMGTPLEKVRS